MPRHMPQSTVDRQQFAEKESEKNISVVFIFISLQSISKSTLFCDLCPFFSTPSLKLKWVLPNMLPCVLPNMKLELRSRGSQFTPPTSSETNPYPKGEHNGAEGPKYASTYNTYTYLTAKTGYILAQIREQMVVPDLYLFTLKFHSNFSHKKRQT